MERWKKKKTKEYLPTINHNSKPTSLTINDGNSESVKVVSTFLTNLNSQDACCELSFHQLDAAKMIDLIISKISIQPSSERNLIFIDPTGYKEIHKADLQKLLQAGKSEVILFLPVTFMHRFKNVVQGELERPAYLPLKRFIYEFFDESHPVRKGVTIR